MRHGYVMRSVLYMLAGVLAAQAGFVLGQEPEEAEAERATLIYAARGVPVADLAQALQELAAKVEVLLVSEPVSNHLILSGAPEAVQSLAAVLERIDRLPRRIEIRLLLVEVRDSDVKFEEGAFDDYAAELEQLQASGAATIVSRMRLTTLENQVAQVQMGATRPSVTGRVFDRGGRGSNSYVMNDEGTLLSVIPRASGDGTIVMELNIEQTRIEDAEQTSADDAEDVVPSTRSTAVINSTVSVKDGETVTTTDVAQNAGDSARNLVVIVTARIIDN
jgi:type II secretory pathway component GspD/PulD (secretin)